MFVGCAGPYAQPRRSILFRSAWPWLAQWPSHRTRRPVLHASFTTPSGMLGNRCFFCRPAAQWIWIGRVPGTRFRPASTQVSRCADRFEGLGESAGQGPAAVRHGLDLGSAVQRPRDLLVMPGRRAPAKRESLQMEGFRAEDRHSPLPHIGPSATALN